MWTMLLLALLLSMASVCNSFVVCNRFAVHSSRARTSISTRTLSTATSNLRSSSSRSSRNRCSSSTLALASHSSFSRSRSRPVTHNNRLCSSTDSGRNMALHSSSSMHKELGRWPPHVPHPTIWSKYKEKIEELSRSLANAGQSGLLAYGLLNFLYYNSVTVIAWIASGRGGLSTLAETTVSQRVALSAAKMAKVAVIVWTSSQVTKFFRIAGAVFFAPVVDRLMADLQKRFRLKSKNIVFWCAVAAILSSTALVYSTLIFWAVFEEFLRNSWALFF